MFFCHKCNNMVCLETFSDTGNITYTCDSCGHRGDHTKKVDEYVGKINSDPEFKKKFEEFGETLWRAVKASKNNGGCV